MRLPQGPDERDELQDVARQEREHQRIHGPSDEALLRKLAILAKSIKRNMQSLSRRVINNSNEMNEHASTTTASGASSQDDPAPRLPTEVCGRIIDHVAAGLGLYYPSLAGNPNLLALQSCALVCRDWYFHTWYHLHRRVYLRDRNDVRSLARTLRERPRLRGVVQQVVISGVIQHLGTFAAMLAGKLQKLSEIIIEDAEWTVDSMRMEDVGYLATFYRVRTLTIMNVTVPSISRLARLISALPGLRNLRCRGVGCSQEHPISPVSLPLNSASLEELDVRWVSPTIQDLLEKSGFIGCKCGLGGSPLSSNH
ncbi:uncharacterized protein C8Q71DRAFT_511952 [Rhodofomes roseus]|uniref:F-box domain-containing protein n=1 Tax=Rhodofomes roseus TaxID=34475 RepID=A0ABQ8KM78_9APHY|nr:uncharacterized protein C8Q71DRAFT_511952 [Rhodofomes roseus]KAH9839434.1 hypothetical protein C8Q71DRAFT_511952 [Rhodofomes roseus]